MKTRYVVPSLLILLGLMVFFTACQMKEVTSAKVYMGEEDWDKAIEQLEKAVEEQPENAEAHFLLGYNAAQKEQWSKVDKHFDIADSLSDEHDDQITAVREQSWINLFNKGVKVLNSGKTDSAISVFETAIMVHPERPETYRTLGISYNRNKEYEKSQKTFEKYISIQPDSVDGYLLLASSLFGLEDYESVIPAMKKALELDPQNADAIVNLAMSYDLLGQSQKAKETYEKALEKNPDNEDILFNLGRLYLMNDELDQALDLFNDLLKKNPHDYEANVSVGQALLQIAQDYQKSLVKKDEEGKEVTDEEMEKLRILYGKAIPNLEKAAEIAQNNSDIPIDSSLYYNLGIAYGQTNQPEKAKEAFDKADELK